VDEEREREREFIDGVARGKFETHWLLEADEAIIPGTRIPQHLSGIECVALQVHVWFGT